MFWTESEPSSLPVDQCPFYSLMNPHSLEFECFVIRSIQHLGNHIVCRHTPHWSGLAASSYAAPNPSVAICCVVICHTREAGYFLCVVIRRTRLVLHVHFVVFFVLAAVQVPNGGIHMMVLIVGVIVIYYGRDVASMCLQRSLLCTCISRTPRGGVQSQKMF